MEKKGQIAVGLIAIIAIAAIVGGIAFVMFTEQPGTEGVVTLVYGNMYGPDDLDPFYAWDSASIDVIDQVTEGLFTYDLSDPDIPIIPSLGLSGSWNAPVDEYTVILRPNVKFHDGTDFNADAVVWWFDRMQWSLNTTLTNTDVITQFAELYELPDGTDIIEDVVKNSDLSVTFVLAEPFLPFQGLLCYSGSHFLSPTAHAGDAEAYLNTATSDLVGTGPFTFDSLEAGVETVMSSYDDYWAGPSKIDRLVISEITDANARNAALLSGDIDYLADPLDAILQVFNYTPGIDIYYIGQSNVAQFLGMNNKVMNITWRKAVSYAFDYEYMVDVLRLGNAVHAKSPIPEGIMYSNWGFDAAFTNVSYARELMQSMGFGTGWNTTVGSSDETAWNTATFATYNYTYNIGNSFREDILVLLQNNLGKIGIVIEDAGMTWPEFTARFGGVKGHSQDELEFFWIGWGADYNDPMNFINPLFTNRSSASNGAQYNGYLAAKEQNRNPMLLNDNVQLLMEAAMAETDPVQREAYYDRIQELLVEEDMPWVWGYASKAYVAYDSNLKGLVPNTMGNEWFYECYFEEA